MHRPAGPSAHRQSRAEPDGATERLSLVVRVDCGPRPASAEMAPAASRRRLERGFLWRLVCLAVCDVWAVCVRRRDAAESPRVGRSWLLPAVAAAARLVRRPTGAARRPWTASWPLGVGARGRPGLQAPWRSAGWRRSATVGLRHRRGPLQVSVSGGGAGFMPLGLADYSGRRLKISEI